ncbi:hypothetical protein CEXT_75991 [Caerostris extrusa]|uniref:Uncharacterized protein n=1 Tax=Caerostris extrusa TaxID=172846 RepID=A0AAV4WCI2_CAEEX|nr:hypothetical protein CEXT_75991 [Caerostris extrusa]
MPAKFKKDEKTCSNCAACRNRNPFSHPKPGYILNGASVNLVSVPFICAFVSFFFLVVGLGKYDSLPKLKQYPSSLQKFMSTTQKSHPDSRNSSLYP